jgi:hypothetical protein
MPSVRVEDYGAYGKLEATANHCKQIPPKENPGDEPCAKTKDCCLGDNIIKLPRDENDNDIADGAQQDKGGASATKDEDNIPSLNPVMGDGFTTYQEYRGFIIASDKNKRSHYRTNTDLKDIFIRNESNLPLSYFRKSNLLISEVNDSNLWQLGDLPIKLFKSDPDYGTPADKLHPIEINYNRCKNDKHCPKTSAEDDWGEQHGLWLAVNNTMTDYGNTECDSPKFDNAEYFIIPKITYKVLVNQTLVRNRRAGVPAVPIPNVVEKTVAHELGHGVNMKHHGDKTARYIAPGAERARTIAGALRVLDPLGNVVPIYYVYGRNGQTSGPTDCIMLYDNRTGWYNAATSQLYEDVNDNHTWDPAVDSRIFVTDDDGTQNRIYGDPIHKYVLPQIVGNTYCYMKRPTNWNRSTNEGGAPTIPPNLEKNLNNPSDRDGCYQQIRVKSWKQTP